MKVLHVAPMDRTIYRFRLGILNAARDMGYETHIWCKNTVQEHVDEMRELGHVVHEAQIERNLGPVNIGSAVRGLRKILRAEKFDIVHTHTPIGGLVGRVAARLERVPNVFHTTGGWYFHEYMKEPKKSMYIKIEKALASITDVIFSVNYEDIDLAVKYGIKPKERYRLFWTGRN